MSASKHAVFLAPNGTKWIVPNTDDGRWWKRLRRNGAVIVGAR